MNVKRLIARFTHNFVFGMPMQLIHNIWILLTPKNLRHINEVRSPASFRISIAIVLGTLAAMSQKNGVVFPSFIYVYLASTLLKTIPEVFHTEYAQLDNTVKEIGINLFLTSIVFLVGVHFF